MLHAMRPFGRRLWVLLGIAALAAILVAPFFIIDRPGQRALGFYLWKITSGKAHGGQCVEINDICIYYETFGAGPPVLVLHGGLGSLNFMKYQIRALAVSHLVIAVDSRAHGQSTDSDAPLSYALMADDMLKLLDRLQIDRVDVVGWSDGAIIGLDLAMHHPERVRRLVAISANYDADGLTAVPNAHEALPSAPRRYRLFAPDPGHWPILVHKVVTMWRTQPHYTLAELQRITAPTLIIAGESDLIKRDHTDRLAKAIPNSREVIIEGGTHTTPNDNAGIVNALITQFLGPT